MRFFLLILIFIHSCYCFSQEGKLVHPFVLATITEENGLSDNHVQCVLKDKKGLVWIGTADGLNLLDGSTIRVFRHRNQDSLSIIDNNIRCLAEDGDGNIWVGTEHGLSCYQSKTGSFHSDTLPVSPYGSSELIVSMVMNRKGTIWCCTDGGLFLYNVPARKFKPYYNNSPDQRSAVYNNKLTHMIQGSNDRLWICSNDGLWSFDLQTLSYKSEINKQNDPVFHPLFLYVFEDHNKIIWTGNWQNGLKQMDPTTGKVTNFLHAPGNPSVTINCINEMQEPDGKYTIWLNGNLQAFDPLTKQYFQYPKPLAAADYPFTSPLYRSTDGWMWMGSDKGLYIYNPRRQYFSHNLFNPILTTQGIVLSEWNQSLLVGAQAGSFLKQYDRSGKLQKNWSPVLLNASRKYGSALCFAKENDHNLWIGTTEGIVAVDMSTGRHRWYDQKENKGLPRNFITHLLFDSRHHLWIFPWREGIWEMNTVTGECNRLWEGFLDGPEHKKRLVIADAIEDADGNLWMADLDEGIILYNRRASIFSKPFKDQLGERISISHIYLQNGFCYAAAPNYIIKWDPKTQKIRKFFLPAEMNKTLYDLAPDKEGNWWLTSKNGLILFNEKQNSFKRFTTNDGLINNDINGTLYCKQDGTMLLGLPEYFTSFNPKSLIRDYGAIPPTMLTGVLVNEKPVLLDNTKPLQLDHRSTNIVFRWSLPDYTNPLRNQYYCKLDGIDSTWTYTGNKGEIQYANLSPGYYTFLYKAAFSDGSDSGNFAHLDFVINPPFWKTTWFIILLSIVLLIIFLFVVRYVSQRNIKEKLLRLEKEQAIEKERNRISRDMHDDLGSGLTKIAVLSEVAKQQLHDPSKAIEQLENIAGSSRELIDSLQDIIWVLNPKNDTLESLAAYTREYTSRFLEPSGISAQFNFPDSFPGIKLSEETRRNIFLVIKESLNNIVKHASCHSIAISLESTVDRIRLTITDDGRGFDSRLLRPFSNGLTNMKNRMQQVGGNLEINSVVGKGTTVTLLCDVYRNGKV